MQPCERSDKVPDNKNSHTLYLAGELWAEVSAQAAALGGRTEPTENQSRSSCCAQGRVWRLVPAVASVPASAGQLVLESGGC